MATHPSYPVISDDLRGLARLLGHTSLDTVMVYTEPMLADLTQRIERVESADQ